MTAFSKLVARIAPSGTPALPLGTSVAVAFVLDYPEICADRPRDSTGLTVTDLRRRPEKRSFVRLSRATFSPRVVAPRLPLCESG